MKVVTILGIGRAKEKFEDRPIYRYDDKLGSFYSLKKQRYTNMLPLLIDNFGEQNIMSIFTKDAKDTNIEVLKKEFDIEYCEFFKDENFIDGDKDFYKILRIINDVTSDNEEYIIDLTHGFRHIPILATISLISQSLNNTDKIKHIFFAKEIKFQEDYEIIDLKEYLELANMSYMLETFDKNYTVSFVAAFKNEDFENLRGELTKFSNDILANSLKALENRFDIVLQYIENIKVEAYVKEFKNSKFFDSYDLTNQSRNLVKIGRKMKSYLFGTEKAQTHFGLSKKKTKEHLCDIKNLICDKLERIPNIENFRNFIFDAEGLRNNLAHGNSSDEIENTKLKFKQLLDEYKKFCIDDDILGASK